VSQKTSHFVIAYIFAKYQPIFTDAFCRQLANKVIIEYPTTLTVSLHYLVKYKCKKN